MRSVPAAVFLCALGVACSTTLIPDTPAVDPGVVPEPSAERCNNLDDDLDGRVDENFVDELGRYVDDAHCGGCDSPCGEADEVALEVGCSLVDGTPRCAARTCAPGYGVATNGDCVSLTAHLCLSCTDDRDCGLLPSALCRRLSGEFRCTIGCENGCPAGYVCNTERCVPSGGSCTCAEGQTFEIACAIEDPNGALCAGRATCDNGKLSDCVLPAETCDEQDNDCDGNVDEDFVDANGVYREDARHCGACGVDCLATVLEQGSLACGGDPFAPRCVLACPDAADGVQPGDKLDADGEIVTGCECTVSALDDEPGPVGAVGEALDVNCDGADGEVGAGVYVAVDGDDSNPGSPELPLRTISTAIVQASATNRDVFVASGVYTEAVRLADGVSVHGGYRRDFLALAPEGFRSEIRAPLDSEFSGGAAMFGEDIGIAPMVVEGLSVRGRDALDASAPAFAAHLLRPGPNLVIRNMTFQAGRPGAGVNGADGIAGADGSEAQRGEIPRAANESILHLCVSGETNAVRGGAGSVNSCQGVDVSGGRGGSARCPSFGQSQGRGEDGRGMLQGMVGSGGLGGQDASGPLFGGSCANFVCCGLADFSVPSEFSGPRDGASGRIGADGGGGIGCSDPLGRFANGEWMPAIGSAGIHGQPGAGGGGGGAGGGVEMEWVESLCAFADGLGGGGGGGGSGGCGGQRGRPGTSGGPSVALLVQSLDDDDVFTIEQSHFEPSAGARGGDGGAGGDGGFGAPGAIGGDLAPLDRTTPTLAGTFGGGRGGSGGAGGAGGGGGGGCGGASVGIWAVGAQADLEAWRVHNTFDLDAGGVGGRAGGGSSPGGAGRTGGARDVVSR